MATLRELFEGNQAGLTVYSPDCAHSRLWGNVDQMIHAETGFEVVRRQWINHDINSILRFYRGPDDEPPAEQDPAEAIRKYDNIPAETLQYGHLVVKLLMMGPSLLTIWRGEDAIPTLAKVKGRTQPAEAAAGTIRGGFWCDNGVCNLTHSSDDNAEAIRELGAVGLDHWLDEDTGHAPLIDATTAPSQYVAHSGIAIAADVVNRMLIGDHAAPLAVTLPASGSAKETHDTLSALLRDAANRHASAAPFIEAYLAGDMVGVTGMLKSLPVTRWEHFVIQCGVVNRGKWNGA